jgi:predicted DNA-binding transcriptional regulator AlpA
VTARFLTIEEVADLRRTTPQAIYSERARGDGPPAYRSGRRLLFDETEVIEWLKSQRDNAARRATGGAAMNRVTPLERRRHAKRTRTG